MRTTITHAHDRTRTARRHAADTDSVVDPVCGMTVDPHTTPAPPRRTTGRTYYFCSAGCRTKFAADPAKYLAPATSAAAEPVPEGTIYTCPMHPEIRQVGPGRLPDLRHGAGARAGRPPTPGPIPSSPT